MEPRFVGLFQNYWGNDSSRSRKRSIIDDRTTLLLTEVFMRYVFLLCVCFSGCVTFSVSHRNTTISATYSKDSIKIEATIRNP